MWYNTLSGDTVIDPNSQEFGYDWCYVHGDDYTILPKDTPLNEVIEKCIEIGSRVFYTNIRKDRVQCRYFIRTPPNKVIRKSREWEEYRDFIGVKTYLKSNLFHRDYYARNGGKTFILNY